MAPNSANFRQFSRTRISEERGRMFARTAKKVPHLPVLEDGFIFVEQESEMRGCSVSGRELQEV